MKPVTFMEARVTSPPPNIGIKLLSNSALELSGDMVTVCEHLTEHTRESDMGTIRFKSAVKSGDRVIVVAFEGNQRFLVIDKI